RALRGAVMTRRTVPASARSIDSRTPARVPPGVSPDQRAEMVASPRPMMPASVWTRTRTKSDVACSPWAVLADRPFLRGTATGIGSMRVIFIRGGHTKAQRRKEDRRMNRRKDKQVPPQPTRFGRGDLLISWLLCVFAPWRDTYSRNRRRTFAVICDRRSSTGSAAGYAIDPAENTIPPDGVSKVTISAPPSSGFRPFASRSTFFGELG